MNVLYSLQHLGYTIPPQADAGWIGEAGPGPSYLDPGSGGPDNDFTNRNTTFMTWNLLHLARMLKDAGGIPAHGNQRSRMGRRLPLRLRQPRVPVTSRRRLHGVGLVDAHALDDGHVAGERLGLLEAVGVEDAVAGERRRRLEGQFGAAVPGDLHAASERAARVDQARPDRLEPFAPRPLDLIALSRWSCGLGS